MGVITRPLVPADLPAVQEALVESRAFSDEELRVALEMVEAGFNDGYSLLAAVLDGHVRGYACIGRTPLTASTWYVYWICVHPAVQGTGVGRALQSRIETLVCESGGDRIVLETSGRTDYERTRRFYQRAGFTVVGCIPDFYKSGDDCVIYCKTLRGDNT